MGQILNSGKSYIFKFQNAESRDFNLKKHNMLFSSSINLHSFLTISQGPRQCLQIAWFKPQTYLKAII